MGEYRGSREQVRGASRSERHASGVADSSEPVLDVLDSMPDGFVAFDGDACYTLVNPAAERLLGRAAAELLGKRLQDVRPDIFGPSLYHTVAEERAPVSFEAFSERTQTWVEVHAFPTGSGVSVQVTDISKRRSAEEMLATSRARADELAMLLDLSSQPFGIGGLNGEALLVNRAFEELTGYRFEELKQLSWATDLTPPEFRALETEKLAELACTGRTVRYEKEYIRKDGSRVPVELLVGILKNELGEPQYFYAFVTDLTERTATQEALRRSEERYRTLFEQAVDGIFLANAQGDYTDVNAAGAEMLGYTRDEIVHLNIADVVEPEEIQRLPEELGRLSTGDVFRSTWRFRRKDGSRFDGEVFARQLAGGGRQAFVRDVSERQERMRLNRTLNEIGMAVTGTFDEDAILSRVFEMAGEAIDADASALALHSGDAWTVKRVDGLEPETLAALLVGLPPPHDVSQTLPLLIDDVASQPETRVIAEMGVTRLLSLPLVAAGRVLGVLGFALLSERHGFTEAQIDFAARLIPVVTVALESASAYRRERRISDALQEAILVPPEPVHGLEVSHLYRPASDAASVGGDFYDLFPLREGRAAVLLGDVSGKGLEAARMTSLVRDGVRAYALERDDPGQVLRRLNELFLKTSPVSSFVTLFLGVLDIDTGHLSYCRAGHPPAVVIGPTRHQALEGVGGSLVGAFADTVFPVAETVLDPGQALVLYTDGLSEAHGDGELFGEERVMATLDALRGSPVASLPNALVDAALAFSAGVLRDDVAILCVSRTGERARVSVSEADRA